VKASRPKFSRVKGGLVVSAAALALAACGGSDKATSAAPSASAPAPGIHAGHSDATVSMRLIQFGPKQIDVAAGKEVTWTQKDAGFHTVTSGTVEQGGGSVTGRPDGTFRSERLATDDTFKFTFNEPGTYPYFCEIHPATMTGEVRVGA
jgi:plastocyanin